MRLNSSEMSFAYLWISAILHCTCVVVMLVKGQQITVAEGLLKVKHKQ